MTLNPIIFQILFKLQVCHQAFPYIPIYNTLNPIIFQILFEFQVCHQAFPYIPIYSWLSLIFLFCDSFWHFLLNFPHCFKA